MVKEACIVLFIKRPDIMINACLLPYQDCHHPSTDIDPLVDIGLSG
jgi:hypothetical protein